MNLLLGVFYVLSLVRLNGHLLANGLVIQKVRQGYRFLSFGLLISVVIIKRLVSTFG